MGKPRPPFDPKVLDAPRPDDGGPANGQSLRDWFAGRALTGVLAAHAGVDSNLPTPTRSAALSYDYADAMLLRRAKAEGR